MNLKTSVFTALGTQLICQLLCAVWAQPVTEHGIFFGGGIVYATKNFMLNSKIKGQKSLSVNDTDKTFQRTRQWFFDNLYDALNRRTRELEKPPDQFICLHSRTLPAPSVADATNSILLIVPLTKEFLGPDYQNKISDLRKIMLSDH